MSFLSIDFFLPYFCLELHLVSNVMLKRFIKAKAHTMPILAHDAALNLSLSFG
jgi:hypothetical protein